MDEQLVNLHILLGTIFLWASTRETLSSGGVQKNETQPSILSYRD